MFSLCGSLQSRTLKARHCPRRWASSGASLESFSAVAQSENLSVSGRACRPSRPPVPSVPGDERIAVEQGFRERKFQHNLAGGVGHFDDRPDEILGPFECQEFAAHGARHFPGAIGIAQLLPLWIGDDLVANARVEEISRHDQNLSW